MPGEKKKAKHSVYSSGATYSQPKMEGKANNKKWETENKDMKIMKTIFIQIGQTKKNGSSKRVSPVNQF